MVLSTEDLGFDHVITKTIKLVFTASLLTVGIMCTSGTTHLPAHYCFSELVLYKSSSVVLVLYQALKFKISGIFFYFRHDIVHINLLTKCE
jgi:hypothetical protein